MVRSKRFGLRKSGLKKRAPRAKKAVVSKPLRRAIKAIARSDAETKYTAWYQGVNDGTVTTRSTGFFSTSGWAVQNQAIALNETDILRLVPQVLEGTGDYNRIGTKIRPVSLIVKGQLRCKLANVLLYSPAAFTVDLYVLQHKRLKSYENLYSLNNFGELLDTGEGGTIGYQGISINSGMRVSPQNYTVLQRKRITLRYNGLQNTGAAAAQVSVDGSHTWYAEYSMNLTKHLPKVLQFPDDTTAGAPTPPRIANAPSNSSIFLCMGYPSWYNNSINSSAATSNNVILEQTYVATMGFKDS